MRLVGYFQKVDIVQNGIKLGSQTKKFAPLAFMGNGYGLTQLMKFQ
jgi:hypothetical protein